MNASVSLQEARRLASTAHMKEIIVRLDVVLALRKMKAKQLAAEISITETNLSLLRTGKVKGIRFDTLARLCEVLDCTPGDLLVLGESTKDENDA